jgi:hypothetical protein
MDIPGKELFPSTRTVAYPDTAAEGLPTNRIFGGRVS